MSEKVTEIDALKLVDDALSSQESDARIRILDWAFKKYGGADTPTFVESQKTEGDVAGELTKGKRDGRRKTKNTRTSTSKKTKPVLNIDKSINLYPDGKQSCPEFAKEKNPTNGKQKGVVAVYYIHEILEMKTVGLPQVSAFFKAANWPLPKHIANVLQQAGSEGWLDTSKSSDIKMTSVGVNLVEHELPMKKN